jgi:hypothetical protein
MKSCACAARAPPRYRPRVAPGLPKAMLSADAAGEDRHVLRHDGAIAARLIQRGFAEIDMPSTRTCGPSGVVKPQMRENSVDLPGAGRAHHGDGFARADMETRAGHGGVSGSRRIGEGCTSSNRMSPTGGCGNGVGFSGARICRDSSSSSSAQPFGGAGGLGQFAPDFGQGAETSGGKDGSKAGTGRACPATCSPASTFCAPIHRTATTLRKGHEDGEAGQHRRAFSRGAGGVESGFDSPAKREVASASLVKAWKERTEPIASRWHRRWRRRACPGPCASGRERAVRRRQSAGR